MLLYQEEWNWLAVLVDLRNHFQLGKQQALERKNEQITLQGDWMEGLSEGVAGKVGVKLPGSLWGHTRASWNVHRSLSLLTFTQNMQKEPRALIDDLLSRSADCRQCSLELVLIPAALQHIHSALMRPYENGLHFKTPVWLWAGVLKT